MIQSYVSITAPDGMREEILEVFRGLTGPTEVTKGFQACRLFLDAEDEDQITYWSLWDSLQELEEYFCSERFRRILPYIEMSVDPPIFDICEVNPIGGIEILVAAIGKRSS